MKTGDNLPPFVIDTVSPEGMREWAQFLDDPNPIHIDPAAVRALGLGDRVINQGPANLAYVMNMLATALPGFAIARIDARFLQNVFGGDRVTAGGTVTAVDETGVACDVWLDSDASGRVISGTALMQRPSVG